MRSATFFSCTEGKAAPALDVIGVGIFLLGATINEDASNQTQAERGEQRLFSIFTAGIFGLSAKSGFGLVKQCQSAQLEAARRRAGENANAPALASPDTDPAPWPAPLAPPLRRPNGATGTGR